MLVRLEYAQDSQHGCLWLAMGIVKQVTSGSDDLIRRVVGLENPRQQCTVMMICHNKRIQWIGKHTLDDWCPAPIT